jgi:hypothetical protein
MFSNAADFFIVLLVGLMCFGLPYGYVLGVVIGTVIAYVMKDRLASTDEHK